MNDNQNEEVINWAAVRLLRGDEYTTAVRKYFLQEAVNSLDHASEERQDDQPTPLWSAVKLSES